MANRDFDPFTSASRGTEDLSPEFLPTLAKAKLDEFFLQVTVVFATKIFGCCHFRNFFYLSPAYLHIVSNEKYSFL